MNSSAALLDQLPVLSDPLRTRVLAVLDGQELTVSELCEVLQSPQSTVSRHLKTLFDTGWIVSRREGTSRFYALNRRELDRGAQQLWSLVREHVGDSPAAAQDEQRLQSVLALRRTRSQEFFSSAAAEWDRLRDELFGADSHLRALLGWLDGEWVVGDLGCGTGSVTEAVAPFVRKVVAVDGSAEMLAAARTRLADHRNVELREGALEQLPVPDAALDAACLVLVLHHAPAPVTVLAEAARVLRPGGRLLLVDMLPHAHEEYRHTMGHVWLGFSEAHATTLLREAGFSAMRWTPLRPAPHAKGPTLFVASARTSIVRAGRGSRSPEPAANDAHRR